MSLAAIKRRVQVGTKLQVVRHDWPLLRLPKETEEEYKAKQEAFFAVRTVVVVHSTEIGIAVGRVDPNGEYYERTSWLSWPKANSIRETAKGFQVDINGDGLFTAIMEYEYR